MTRCFNATVLAIMGSLCLSGCYISAPKQNWKRATWDSLTILDGRTFSIDIEGKGLRVYECSGHNPIIGICFSPRKRAVYLTSDGKELWRTKVPRRVHHFRVVDENRILAFEQAEGAINVVEITPGAAPRKLGEISWRLHDPASGKKLDITISRRGNLVGWAEPEGLSVLNLSTGERTKHLEGLPVRLPVFSEDESMASAYVWIGTMSASNLPAYQDSTTLIAYEMQNRAYIEHERRSVFVGTTTEHLGIVAVDLRTGELVKISPQKRDVIPSEICGNRMETQDDLKSCRSKFSDYAYRNSYSSFRREPRSFYIDDFRREIHFRKNDGKLEPWILRRNGGRPISYIPQKEP